MLAEADIASRDRRHETDDDEKLVLLTIDAIESEIDAGESDGELLEPATPLEIASRAQLDVGTVNAAPACAAGS